MRFSLKPVKLFFLFIIPVFFLIYFLGPSPDKPALDTEIPKLNIVTSQLSDFVNDKEASIKNLKPKNGSSIVWKDSVNKTKTPYCLVYIHGFSASPEEGNGLHKEFAKRFGCNAYLHRLVEHGIKEQEPFLKLTPEKLVASAKEAIAIGKLLGDKVILMSTSTGGTLSLYLASGNPDIHSLILYSPNIDLFDPRSFILTQPWGLQIARMVNGGKYYHFDGPVGVDSFWTTTYRIEALVALKMLMEETMKEKTFKKVKQHVFVGYYPEDNVVSVSAIKEMYQMLGTEESKRKIVAFPNAGNHAIASTLWSHDIASVQNETFIFAQDVLGLKKE